MVFFIVLSNSAAIALFGWTGLPWQLSALISRPLSATVDLKVLRAAGSASRVSGSAWELPG